MKSWQDLGQGRWKLTITDDENPESVPSVYRGTKDEIADLLAESQHHANRRIAELKRGSGNGKSVHFGPVAGDAPSSLTPGERMQTVADLQNPSTVVEGVTRVVESAMGETMEQRRERQQQEDLARYNSDATDAAVHFTEQTPEYYLTPHNANTMAGWMNSQGMDLRDINNYGIAFERLSAAKLLQTRPAEVENENESEEEEEPMVTRNAPTPTPRPRTPARISTGVSSRDISGTPPRPVTRLKYSREQLDKMSAQDYKQLMLTDRAELERCEGFYAKNPARRAS